MFEAAELGHKLSKREYEEQLPGLRQGLVAAHFGLKEAGVPVLIIISGVEGAGKAELVHRLNEWLDPRGVDTHAFWQRSDEEAERPRYWRFWKRLPARGRVGIFFGSWYSEPIIERVYKRLKTRDLDSEMDRIAFLERMLVDDGALIVKLWFHLPKKQQERHLKAMEKDPKMHWRVLPRDWKHFKMFDKFVQVSERAIRHTDFGHAPWHVVEASDRRYRELTCGRILLEAMRLRLAEKPSRAIQRRVMKAAIHSSKDQTLTILDHVDLTQRLSREQYRKLLAHYQGELARLAWRANEAGISSVMVFEGWDAAGKGSAIRRVTAALDPRLYHVIPIGVPTDEEKAHHYLWRFWRHLPRAGRMSLFDRSWYGRVLVERVERFATDEEWQRSYVEINDFEEQLAQHHIVISKFWLHISQEEQLKRFKAREADPARRFKITPEDWRNRKKWDAYKEAVNDMVAHTSTGLAPWTLVAGDDKLFARIQILKTLCDNLNAALKNAGKRKDG